MSKYVITIKFGDKKYWIRRTVVGKGWAYEGTEKRATKFYTAVEAEQFRQVRITMRPRQSADLKNAEVEAIEVSE